MQQWSPDGVKQERSGWRDESISARHRLWGFDCPAVDIDFLVSEFNAGLAVAIVEYKHFRARIPDANHPAIRAFRDLTDNRINPLPFLIVRYWPGDWAFQVAQLNPVAEQNFSLDEMMSELDFVMRLYKLRRLRLAAHLEGKLNTTLPLGEAAKTAMAL
jgi:hypothetical protein